MKQHNLSIAIPAYNEEANIENLLTSLLNQKSTNFSLSEIIVYSDASSDTTDEIVQKLGHAHPVIKLVRGNERRGKYARMNQAFADCKTDSLIILDADIALGSEDFLEKLVQSLIDNPEAVMIAAHNILLRPSTFIGKLIHTNFMIWDFVRFSVPNYDFATNYYGTATIFRGTFARSINIPDEIADPHLYIYLSAKKVNGFKYCREAEVLQWPIATIADYKKFLRRSLGKKDKELEKIFGENIEKIYDYPRKYKISGVLKALKWQPIYTPLAIIFDIYMSKIRPIKNVNTTQVWDIVSSTKKPIRSQRKSIVISTYDDIKNPHYAGGGAIAVHEVAKKLSEIYDVSVLSWNHSGKKTEIIDGVFYKRFGYSFINPKVGMFIFQVMLPLRRLFEKHDLWLESFSPPFTTSFLPLFSKKPVIGVLHMLAAEDMYRKYKVNTQVIERSGLKKYEHIIVTNETMKEKIQEINPYCICNVIGNGIEKVSENNSSKKKQLLFIGRLEVDQKGLDLLLEAFLEFDIRSTGDYKLVIAGNGLPSEQKKLEELVKFYGVTDKVVLAGRVTGDKKKELLEQSECMIITSRFETHSIVALEALSYGLPLVCFDIEGLKWIPEDAALKIEPFNVEKLGGAILKLVTDSKHKKKMKKIGLSYSQEYTWDKITDQYVSYVNETLAG